MKKKKPVLTAKYLEKYKVPKVVVIGLLIASALGWTGWTKIKDFNNYYRIKQVFPVKTHAIEVLDGDTFVMENGLTLRLVGIDAPQKGQPNFEESTNYLYFLVSEKDLQLEYDAYQDDKFGRVLAYVFIPCFQDLRKYCRNDRILVNEVMVKKGFAQKVVYSKRKKLKYDDWLN